MKAQLKSKAETTSVNNAIKKAAVLWFAPEFIFKAVLIKTAVFGSPQTIQVHIFDIARPNTSLSLSNLTFVNFSAILAEIIVSIIAIIATTKDIETSHFATFKKSKNDVKWSEEKYEKSHKENAKLGYLSTKSKIFGINHFEDKYQTQIHIIVRAITAGNFGANFFKVSKNTNQRKNIIKEATFISVKYLKISKTFIKASLCCSNFKAGSFSQNAQGNWLRAIVIQTDIKNQWRAVDGIRVIYLVNLNKYTSKIKNHEKIAISGNKNTQFSGCNKTNHIKILDKAPATQNTL